MKSPLVTVVCLCYNQERFVREAIQSVVDQTYPNIELLIVDDASKDGSVRAIQECIKGLPNVRFFSLPKNVGNCKAFNHALKYAEGEYVIDLAADDVLMPERIEKGAIELSASGKKFCANFTDAIFINKRGEELYLHSDKFPHATMPEGDVYSEIVRRFFILSATLMFRADVLKDLGGYDETLAYEDFDIMIRTSRKYLYCYTPEALVKKRIVKGSMSFKQFLPFSAQSRSTYKILRSAQRLNRNEEERKALSERLGYEMRLSLRLLDLPLLVKYAALWFRNTRLKY